MSAQNVDTYLITGLLAVFNVYLCSFIFRLHVSRGSGRMTNTEDTRARVCVLLKSHAFGVAIHGLSTDAYLGR